MYLILPLLLILAISVYTDLRSRLIYDWATIPGMIYYLLLHLFAGERPIGYYLGGFALLGGTTLLLGLVGRGQIGGGDIKLFALMGLALGWEAGLMVLLGSTLMAAAFTVPVVLLRWIRPNWRGMRELPMAPFIALSVGMLFGVTALG